MKKTFFLSAMAAVAMLMSSCSSDEPINGQENKVVKGEPTYASFSLSMANSDAPAAAPSRATDTNAVSEETKVSKASVYIFSGGVLEAFDANKTVTSNTTTPIQVTTGEKTVFVITGTVTLADLEIKADKTLLTAFENSLYAALEGDIAKSNAFVMVGRADHVAITRQTADDAKNNPISVNVDRSAAKVQVTFDNPNVRPTLVASFGNAEFALAQQARQMYVQLGANYTPLGDVTDATYAGLVAALDPAATATPKDYFIAAPKSADKSMAKNKYTAECVVENPTTGNTTFATVRVKCTPNGNLYGDKEHNADGTFYVIAKRNAENASWVFVADESYNQLYFQDSDDAAEYMSSHDLDSDFEVYEYPQGICYYRVNIKHAVNEKTNMSLKYRVVRNNYYQINITDIKALGAPTYDGVIPEDPDTPIEQDNYIAAEIFVNAWTAIPQGAVLQ